MKLEKAPNSKRPYEAPRVRTIELTPSEVVMGGCKSPTGSGPVVAGCLLGGFPPTNCNEQGS